MKHTAQLAAEQERLAFQLGGMPATLLSLMLEFMVFCVTLFCSCTNEEQRAKHATAGVH
jgi:hypothetical protein